MVFPLYLVLSIFFWHLFPNIGVYLEINRLIKGIILIITRLFSNDWTKKRDRKDRTIIKFRPL
jgi:hypothetical protein